MNFDSLKDTFGISFDSKLAGIKSSFQSAHDSAVKLIAKMNDKIAKKEDEVKKIQSEIKDIETIKSQADKFVTNLKSILA